MGNTPIDDSDAEEKETFFEQFNVIQERLPKDDITIMKGNQNVKMKSDTIRKGDGDTLSWEP